MQADTQAAAAVDFLSILERTKDMPFADAHAQYGEMYLMIITTKEDVALHEMAKQIPVYRKNIMRQAWQHLIKACSPIVFYEFDLLTKYPDQSLITIWQRDKVCSSRDIALDLAWLSNKDRHKEVIDSIYNHKNKNDGKSTLYMICVVTAAFRHSTPAFDKVYTYAAEKRDLLEKSLKFWIKSSPRSLQDIAMTQIVLKYNMEDLPHILRKKYCYYEARQGQICDITYINACEEYYIGDTQLAIDKKRDGYRLRCRGCFGDTIIVHKEGKRAIMCEYVASYNAKGVLADFSGEKPVVMLHKMSLRDGSWSTKAHGAMFM